MLNKISFLIVISTIVLSCIFTQKDEIANYSLIDPEGSDQEFVESSLIKAENIFRTYTGRKPKKISLFFPDSVQNLKNEDISILKDSPEAYFFTLPALQTKRDTAKIVEEFIENLSGRTIVQYDSTGKIMAYLSGLMKLPANTDTRIKSSVKNNNIGNNIESKFLDELDQKQTIEVAMYDFAKYNKKMDPSKLYKYFLWCNFYYEYFEINQAAPSGGIPRWVIDFSLIDAAMLDVKDFPLTEKNSMNMKLNFTKFNYEGEFQGRKKSKSNLWVPQMDNYWTEKWKYIELNVSDHLEFENDTFLKMTLFVSYLKAEYGDDVIRDMVKWYIENDYKLMLFATFINKSYQKKTNFKEISADFNKWVEEVYR